MADPQHEPEAIDVERRPFLQGLPPQRPAAEPAPRSATGTSHLIAAATGAAVQPAAPVHPETIMIAGVPVSMSPATADVIEETTSRPERRTSAPVSQPAHAVQEVASPYAISGEPVDYDLVTQHVRELDLQEETSGRAREVFDIATASPQPETAEEEAAWRQIEVLVTAHVSQLVMSKGNDFEWSDAQKAAHVQAVFDEAFRYGPISPLLREDVENIDIHGYDNVTVTFPDGHKEQRPPVTSSDDQLEEYIAKVASDRGRQFARPHGSIKLDLGGARFTALGGPQIVPRPRVAIRKHRLVDIELQSLVRYGTLTAPMAEFLTASMRAYASHMVSGFAGTGKTTFLRALASALPPLEPIVTIETERELYLHKLVDRHRLVDPLQYLPHVNSGDDRTAAFSLDTGIEYALRLNSQVIFFGEILGPDEAASAIKALQAGKGASSTIHASSAYDAIQRLSTALVQAGGLSDEIVPQRQIMQALDIIIQLDIVPMADGSQRRVVSEISEVIPGDAAGGREQKPIVKPIYRWSEDVGVFEFVEEPSRELRKRLDRAGLRPTFFQERAA